MRRTTSIRVLNEAHIEIHRISKFVEIDDLVIIDTPHHDLEYLP
jgi:hypothetical protein